MYITLGKFFYSIWVFLFPYTIMADCVNSKHNTNFREKAPTENNYRRNRNVVWADTCKDTLSKTGL